MLMVHSLGLCTNYSQNFGGGEKKVQYRVLEIKGGVQGYVEDSGC